MSVGKDTCLVFHILGVGLDAHATMLFSENAFHLFIEANKSIETRGIQSSPKTIRRHSTILFVPSCTITVVKNK